MDKMPKDSFTRTNGGATEEYNIGNYKGNTYGKCMLFIWNGYEPVVMIKGDNKTVFVNYKEDGEALKLYEQLSSADKIWLLRSHLEVSSKLRMRGKAAKKIRYNMTTS